MHIKSVFENPKPGLLNIFCTAGYPELDSLPTILRALEKGGVDMVEIGIPYSDPLSDGPTIQNCSAKAISNGISMELIFEQVKSAQVSTPLILMGYFNSVYLYGVEAFCQQCKEVGVSGLILPDLPIGIYKSEYKALFEQYGLSKIFLITPETNEERIRLIDANSSSFIYAVTSSSTTGGNKSIEDGKNYLERLRAMSLKHPIMTGFNIRTNKDFQLVSKYVAGGIIGSAFLRSIAGSDNLEKDTISFVEGIRTE